jgi:hypothetical protein
MHRHTNSGIPTGIGDGESENAPSPASPDGDEFWSAKLPAGSKNLPFTSPNRGIPRRGSGIGAPLPSLPTTARPPPRCPRPRPGPASSTCVATARSHLLVFHSDRGAVLDPPLLDTAGRGSPPSTPARPDATPQHRPVSSTSAPPGGLAPDPISSAPPGGPAPTTPPSPSRSTAGRRTAPPLLHRAATHRGVPIFTDTAPAGLPPHLHAWQAGVLHLFRVAALLPPPPGPWHKRD